ncbi:MAG: hypothetical protein HOY78_02600 [Saccharothrix sp.]|nr:hypothetical protein [Saccharothrix sp.]
MQTENDDVEAELMALPDAYTTVTSADDVPQELLDHAVESADSRFGDGPIDWNLLIDRLDGWEFPDGLLADFGDDMDSPAIRKIKAHVRKVRRDSPR